MGTSSLAVAELSRKPGFFSGLVLLRSSFSLLRFEGRAVCGIHPGLVPSDSEHLQGLQVRKEGKAGATTKASEFEVSSCIEVSWVLEGLAAVLRDVRCFFAAYRMTESKPDTDKDADDGYCI